jgi:hypothetical protein
MTVQTADEILIVLFQNNKDLQRIAEAILKDSKKLPILIDCKQKIPIAQDF